MSTVPPKVPPIKVYASVSQKTEWLRGMNVEQGGEGRQNDRAGAVHGGLDHGIERR